MGHTYLYARVSTDGQTVAHQRTQAEQAGFTFDDVIVDDGVSGVSVPFAERPGARRLFDLLRRGDRLVVRWVDRLGRNYADVRDTMLAFMARGVVIRTIIQDMTFDGADTNPSTMAMRDAIIMILAAQAQAQAEATKEAQKAGIAHARAQEDAGSRYAGRKPTYDRATLATVRDLLTSGTTTVSGIARDTGLTRQTVLRIKANPVAAEAALARWGM